MQPFTLLIKPSGSDCNIDCKYCFYKDRPSEFGHGKQRMSAEVLETLVKDYMDLDFPVAGFAWQGGEPTLMGVDFFRRAVELQKKYGSANVEQPETLFEFCIENELTYLQFIPCVETDPATGGPAEFSITPRQYGDFLCRLFDLWYDYGPEKLNIREFDSLLTHYVLGKHTICTYSKQCAGFVVIEHTGDAFCCEFFVEPKWRLGNILETPLEKLAGDSKKRAFARDKEKLCNKCLLCRHLDICRGGCMKDRARWNEQGGERESYFCESYRQFFDNTVPRFMQIAAGIENGSVGRHTRSADKIRLHIEKLQRKQRFKIKSLA